jgi:hypothetical protein
MKTRTSPSWLGLISVAMVLAAGCGEVPKETEAKSATAAKSSTNQATFVTPEAAVAALTAASEPFDPGALTEILGADGVDLVITADRVLDKTQGAAFAAKAREKTQIVLNQEDPNVAEIVVGAESWPMPVPLVRQEGRWRFDSAAGRQEVLYRRIGENELCAIDVCLGYVEAQYEYAAQKRDGARVNQYAQRLISTPGKQDGLAWQLPDGTWDGPVGHAIAAVITEGYTNKGEPFHGYYFKILKGQGPDAPMGEIDFVVKDVMIGGFALVAAPSNYGVTGVKTFIVSQSGIVYEKDLGPETPAQFEAMERYNPDSTWTPVKEL